MAGRTVMARPNVLSRSALQLSSIPCQSWPTLASRQTVRHAQPFKTNPFSKPSLRNSFRRTYADAATQPPPPFPKPKRRFRFLRWALRLTLLAVGGGAAAVGYGVYTHRYPVEQVEPDPEKKTLVILGRWTLSGAKLVQSHEREKLTAPI